VPIEVRRFGIGHRRPEGPPGTVGVTGGAIHSDERGFIGELAFGRGARIEPHTSPNTIWFIVIEGGGWVGVGDERTRVAAGEAVLWPPDLLHSAWTEHSEMRAIVIELVPGESDIVVDPTRLAGGEAPVDQVIGSLRGGAVGRSHDAADAGEPA